MGEKSQFGPVMELQGKEQAPGRKNRKFCMDALTSLETGRGKSNDTQAEAMSQMQLPLLSRCSRQQTARSGSRAHFVSAHLSHRQSVS